MSREDFSITVNGDCLEYIDDIHTYLVNGQIVPSITQIMKVRFADKYTGIARETLEKAADYGTGVHRAIEMYVREGWTACETMGFVNEVRNFEWLKKTFQFETVDTEVPVILYDYGTPIAAGRLDLVLKTQGVKSIADIKTTATLDKEYLAIQLNLYRRAYQQSYGETIGALDAIHLRRKEVRKFVPIPINEEITDEVINEFLTLKEKGETNNE